MPVLTTALLAAKAVPTIDKLVGNLIETYGSELKEKALVELRVGFENYVHQSLERFTSFRTILGNIQNTTLDALYVNINLQGPDGAVYRDDDLLGKDFINRRILITATAGAGKSMLMRYLYFMHLHNVEGVLPVFIELRELNGAKEVTVFEIIRRKLALHIRDFSETRLQYAMDRGLLIFFFDGFDEIDYDDRETRGKEINRFEEKNTQAGMFISSRPEQGLGKWENIAPYRLLPLSEKQVRLFIQKIPYDQEGKNRFIARLDDGLYNEHKEFLVNPLLVVMMLLTIDYFSDIPGKIYLFYEYAFEALFKRHDATKTGIFQRKREVALELDDYRRLFAYFSAITYLKSALSFTEATALGYLQQSITSSQIEVDKGAMLYDLIQCTCLLARDGLEVTYSHRSFQEYFTAFFLPMLSQPILTK